MNTSGGETLDVAWRRTWTNSMLRDCMDGSLAIQTNKFAVAGGTNAYPGIAVGATGDSSRRFTSLATLRPLGLLPSVGMPPLLGL